MLLHTRPISLKIVIHSRLIVEGSTLSPELFFFPILSCSVVEPDFHISQLVVYSLITFQHVGLSLSESIKPTTYSIAYAVLPVC